MQLTAKQDAALQNLVIQAWRDNASDDEILKAISAIRDRGVFCDDGVLLATTVVDGVTWLVAENVLSCSLETIKNFVCPVKSYIRPSAPAIMQDLFQPQRKPNAT